MYKIYKQSTIAIIVTVSTFLLFHLSVNAATLQDAKNHIANGTGKMMVPSISTDDKRFREMTPGEEKEYFAYIDKYQSENNTDIVPSEAYNYVQYISEALSKSGNKEITDDIRSQAEDSIKTHSQTTKVKSNKKMVSESSNKTKNKETSFWNKLLNLFKL